MAFCDIVPSVRALERRFVDLTEAQRRHLTCGATTFITLAGHGFDSPEEKIRNKFRARTGPKRHSLYARCGINLERFVLRKYAETFNKVLLRDGEELPWVRHADYSWLVTNADGITLDGVLIEIKVRSKRKRFDGGSDRRNLREERQVKISMAILNLHKAELVEYCRESGRIKRRQVSRDDTYLAKNLAQVRTQMSKLYYALKNQAISANRNLKCVPGLVDTALEILK